MIVAHIISILVLVIGLLFAVIEHNGAGFIILSLVACTVTGYEISHNSENMVLPTALDVYRGKTELVINYECRDSTMTPIDSVVIFKDNL